MAVNLKSIVGRALGMGTEKQLVSNGIEITRPCVDATITVGAESTDVRAITIQLTDADGSDIDYSEEVEIVMYADANRDAYVVTGGSTGIEAGTDGALLDVVAKKLFRATSETDGDIDLTWTDTGSEAAYLGLKLPNGRFVMSDALTNST